MNWPPCGPFIFTHQPRSRSRAHVLGWIRRLPLFRPLHPLQPAPRAARHFCKHLRTARRPRPGCSHFRPSISPGSTRPKRRFLSEPARVGWRRILPPPFLDATPEFRILSVIRLALGPLLQAGKAGRRRRAQAHGRDRLAAHVADAVSAIHDSAERLLDLGHFARTDLSHGERQFGLGHFPRRIGLVAQFIAATASRASAAVRSG